MTILESEVSDLFKFEDYFRFLDLKGFLKKKNYFFEIPKWFWNQYFHFYRVSVFWPFLFEDYFRFLYFKWVFFSLFFDFLKFQKWFWNQNGHIFGGSVFCTFSIWGLYIGFWYLKGVFLIYGGQYSVLFQFEGYL